MDSPYILESPQAIISTKFPRGTQTSQKSRRGLFVQPHHIYIPENILDSDYNTTVTYLRNKGATYDKCILALRKTERKIIQRKIHCLKLKNLDRRYQDDTAFRRKNNLGLIATIHILKHNKQQILKFEDLMAKLLQQGTAIYLLIIRNGQHCHKIKEISFKNTMRKSTIMRTSSHLKYQKE